MFHVGEVILYNNKNHTVLGTRVRNGVYEYHLAMKNGKDIGWVADQPEMVYVHTLLPNTYNYVEKRVKRVSDNG